MAQVAIIGAGIAGVSLAHRLSTHHGITDVVVVDPRPPLTLTSDKSTECYRNWWPNAPMVGLMNRSIDLLEEMAEISGNQFGLNRRGYLFATAKTTTLERMISEAKTSSVLGGGSLRYHPGPEPYQPHQSHGFRDSPVGADIFTTGDALRDFFPYISADVVGGVHVRRAGWFSAQQLGAWMLETAQDLGVRHLVDEVVAIDLETTRLSLKSGTTLDAEAVVIAAGPLSPKVAAMAAIDLPIFSELHLKVGFRDHKRVVPRDSPMIIWSDSQTIEWSPEERAALAEMGRDDLLGEMPIFCHGRPEGSGDSPYLLALWEYHGGETEPVWPLPNDEFYPEVVLRGLTTMVPGLEAYSQGLPAHEVDGGYYSKTRENRPLIGPAGPKGIHLLAGMSGFGVMVAAGAADLAARHIARDDLPDYAPAFLLSRYEDATYLAEIEAGAASGQL